MVKKWQSPAQELEDSFQGEMAQQRFLVMQLNMWGWKGFQGDPQIGHVTAKSIQFWRPKVVTLNEACLNQVEALTEDLKSWGLAYQWHHDQILIRSHGGRECLYGNAVLWEGEVAERKPEVFLPVADQEQERKLLAVLTEIAGKPTALCVTHLSSGQAGQVVGSRPVQAKVVADYIGALKSEGLEVILGGDFNEEPHSRNMDPLYDRGYGGGSNGICLEATGGEPAVRRPPFQPTTTIGKKIDYIFMTKGFEPVGSLATHSASDHHPYLASVWSQAEGQKSGLR